MGTKSSQIVERYTALSQKQTDKYRALLVKADPRLEADQAFHLTHNWGNEAARAVLAKYNHRAAQLQTRSNEAYLAATQQEINAKHLAEHLAKRSKEICQISGCREDDHKCESYAYINQKVHLLDICYPDYFQGSGSPYAAIPMPFEGTGEELLEEIDEQCFEN